MVSAHAQSFTFYGQLVLVWILISAFQYGFHISALNQISAVLTCRTHPSTVAYNLGLPGCIPMTDEQFSTVTASFTLGGLAGSLLGNKLTEKQGRKGAMKVNAILVGAGAGLMTLSGSVTMMIIGRMLIGIGAGIGVCVGPVFIGEIAPAAIKGKTGVLFQLSVVFGILSTQSLGIALATPSRWRLVLLSSTLLSIIQFFVSAVISESPAWLAGNARASEAQAVRSRLWVGDAGYESVREEPTSPIHGVADDVDDPLLFEAPEGDERPVFTSHTTKSIGMLQLLRSHDMRTPLLIMGFAMAAQQFSGINAVLYYSNNILGKTLPAFASYVSLGITVVNVVMTFPPIFLIEHMGRKSLLNISIAGAFLSLVAVGYGLDSGMKVLSSLAIITFVASFACGLGPVPFVVISDVAPYHAVSALSSAALSLNWIANFIVGLIFLPLRNFLAWGDPLREGRVFYVFAAALLVFSLSMNLVYRGY